MFTKRMIGIVTATALSLTLLATPAMADTAQSTTSDATTTSTTTTTPPATPDWSAQIKAKYDTILQLRQQESDLQSQLKQQHQTNTDLWKRFEQASTGGIGQQVKDLSAQIKAAYDANVKPLMDQIKSLEAQAKQAHANKDEATALSLRLQANQLRAQVKAAADKVQPLRDQKKQLEAQVKAKRDAVAAVRGQIKPLTDQEKALYDAIRELDNSRNAAWKAVDAAVKAGDVNGALAGLDQVISYKQQAIAKLQQILTIRQQIGSIIQAAIDAAGATSTSGTSNTSGTTTGQ